MGARDVRSPAWPLHRRANPTARWPVRRQNRRRAHGSQIDHANGRRRESREADRVDGLPLMSGAVVVTPSCRGGVALFRFILGAAVEGIALGVFCGAVACLLLQSPTV